MTTIQNIINAVDKTLVERYKNMTGDDDELFERVATYLIEGFTNISLEDTIKKFGEKYAQKILVSCIVNELEAFGG